MIRFAPRIQPQQQFFDEYGVWLSDDDIQLSGSSRRRLLSGFQLSYTIVIPAELDGVDTTSSAADSSSTNAAAVTDLLVSSVRSDAVASALNVSTSDLAVSVIGAPSQETMMLGACPAGKHVPFGMSECVDCAPGKVRSFNESADIDSEAELECQPCVVGRYAMEQGMEQCNPP